MREIDSKLSEEDLDGIIEEVDEDGSGTLDFDGNENETYTPIQYSMFNSLFFRIHGDDDGIEEVRCLSKYSFMINSVGTIIYSMTFLSKCILII